MGKKAEDMSAEELEERRERMKELRVLANKKRMENAAVKREAKDDLKAVKEAEVQLKKELAETKRRNIEMLAKEIEENESIIIKKERKKPIEHGEPEESPRAPTNRAPNDAFQLFQMMSSMKEELKQKYKNKYKTQAVPPPPPPKTDVVRASAKEVLSSKVNAEIQKMAYRSLFGADP